MKTDRVRLVWLTFVILVTTGFSILVLRNVFPAFDYAEPSNALVEVTTKLIGLEVSRFLWTYRLIDLIAQAFILFVAATCCVALLRTEEEKK